MTSEEQGKRTVVMRMINDALVKHDGAKALHMFVPGWMWPWGDETLKTLEGTTPVVCFRCAYSVPMAYPRGDEE